MTIECYYGDCRFHSTQGDPCEGPYCDETDCKATEPELQLLGTIRAMQEQAWKVGEAVKTVHDTAQTLEGAKVGLLAVLKIGGEVMKKDQALAIVMRQAPCPHEHVDKTLGNGKVWCQCQDCGETLLQTQLKESKERADEFQEAMDVLTDKLKKKKKNENSGLPPSK